MKLRNEKNAAKPWVAKAMAELAQEKKGTEAHRIVTFPDGTLGYAEAIWVTLPCLVCHGQEVAPTLDAKLKKAYPNDAARGFELGDFRGVFWAEVKSQKP